MPLVSILLPVYNVEDFIKETIDSILAQTFIDFELIVIDDSSSDNTVNIIERYLLKDNRIKLLQNYENLGIAKTLNHGLNHAEGIYIARIDGDDLMDKTRLDKQINFLSTHLDYGLVGCWIHNINEQGKVINSSKYPVSHEQVLECIDTCSPILHIWMARTKLYKELNGYRGTNPAEDYDFILRSIDAGYKVGNLAYFGAKVRLRQGNTMSNSAFKQRLAFNVLRKLYLNGKINLDKSLDFKDLKLPYCHALLSLIHDISVKCLRKALETDNRLKKVVWGVLSLISPYTAQDILRRKKFKKIMLSQNFEGKKV